MDDKDTFYRRLFIHVFSLLLLLLASAYIGYASFFHDYTNNPDSIRIIDTVLGFLLGVALTTVVNYFYGSSQGSVNKSEQIERMNDGK